MDLEDFIASTLAQIARGVERAQENVVGENGPWVSPLGSNMPTLQGMALMPTGTPHERVYLQNVSFDVAVTVSDKIEGKAEGGIKVMSIGASAGGSKSNENTSASRVQFNVPLVLPSLRFVAREDALKQRRSAKLPTVVRRDPFRV